MTDFPSFLQSREGSTCVVTIDRPEARNALTSEMRRNFGRLFATLDTDEDVNVVILTGSDPAFTAGIDLKERMAAGAPLPRVKPNPGEVLRSFSKPVICAVNGPCVTGGLEIALSCTFILASNRAEFKDTHARLGLMPGWGLSALLPRAIGARRAADMTISGRVVLAEEALSIGLVSSVVDHGDLIPTALKRAAAIATADQAAVRASLALYRRGDGVSFDEALTYEREAADSWRTDPSGSLARMTQITGKG